MGNYYIAKTYPFYLYLTNKSMRSFENNFFAIL